MPFFESPASLRLRDLAARTFDILKHHRRDVPAGPSTQSPFLDMALANVTVLDTTMRAFQDHSSHPNFIHLAGLVCEAVLEVVFVALPGFLVARTGMFDANSQKFVAELNTMVFTPCLIFTKLASQLNADKLGDLAVIPIIFIAQTLVSYVGSQLMARVFGFGKKKREKNFIIAMGVFGNSNSLPISLVLSLSQTISGLHWDKVPGDNDDEVGARGILYLMIFQQLGQLLRWTWGYSVLLKPKEAYDEEERRLEEENDRRAEEGGREGYRDAPEEEERDRMLEANGKPNGKPTDSGFGSGSQTPLSSVSSSSTSSSSQGEEENLIIPTSPVNTNLIDTGSPTSQRNSTPRSATLEARARSTGHITTFPNFSTTSSHKSFELSSQGFKDRLASLKNRIKAFYARVTSSIYTFFHNIFRRLPTPVQKTLSFLHKYNCKFWAGVRRQMNPPLWAMLAALVVASFPKLQHIFFDKGTLINNSLTHAIQQSGGVAVPLILVVLGANLARSTLPQDQLAVNPEEKAEERRLLFASLISRMLIPTIVMAPILALMAKYVPVSILDDPIFIIVCFLLTGAPSALQLAQICQINSVFMGAMSNLLVASYVVAIFPSTLLLVLLALEVVH